MYNYLGFLYLYIDICKRWKEKKKRATSQYNRRMPQTSISNVTYCYYY